MVCAHPGAARTSDNRNRAFNKMRSLLLLWAASLAAQIAPGDLPVALVLQGGGATLTRTGATLPILAKAGDLVYSGDVLSAGARTVNCRNAICPAVPRDRGASLFNGAALTRALLNEEEGTAGTAVPPLSAVRQAELDGRLAAIQGDPLYIRIAKAEVLAEFGREAAAAAAYRAIKTEVPELAAQRIFVLDEAAVRRRAPKPDPTIGGKTYALLIGISQYQNAQIRPLRYAHEDALLMEQLLKSPRGGELAPEDITVLVNEAATTAAIKTAFETILKRATPKDTVILLMASHGTVVESSNARLRGAYIVTYDSDPEDLAATALPMPAVQRFIRDELGRTARVIAFVDACRSGTIGTIPDRAKLKINAQLDALTQTDTQLFLFTASRPGEVSFEGRQYGGGHGAFSFFLLEALNGAADFDQDGQVTVNEMTTYVQQKVAEATVDKQHPREGGTLDTTVRIANARQPGIALPGYVPGAVNEPGAQFGVARGLETHSRDLAVRVLNIRQAVDFDEALRAGRILPDDPANAFTAFRQLKLARKLTREQVLAQENRLRTALEERNQQTLLDYLKGDQQPATRRQFIDAARTINAAIQINGETPYLLSRLQFCEGRVAILDKDYATARRSLEAALRLDSGASYIYNALGTAYLEQAEFDLARKAFDEAIRRAPQWAYPRHNRALLQMQQGDLEAAAVTYDEAIRLAPQYAYLPYNQGLIYQKLNQPQLAAQRFREAMAKGPQLVEPLTALGALEADQGHWAAAEKLLRQAIQRDPKFLPARHNLASVLARQPERRPEAVTEWRAALAIDPDYTRARLSLAQALKTMGEPQLALAEYQQLVQRGPKVLAARMELARLLASAGKISEAILHLEVVYSAQPANPVVAEQLGDLLCSSGRSVEGQMHYQSILDHDADPEIRKRVRGKLKSTISASRQ